MVEANDSLTNENGERNSPWLLFGQRNILYLGFVMLLPALGLALDGPRPAGSQSLGGMGLAVMACTIVSLLFFAINAGLAVMDLIKRRRAVKSLTGCGLALMFGGAAILARGLAF